MLDISKSSLVVTVSGTKLWLKKLKIFSSLFAKTPFGVSPDFPCICQYHCYCFEYRRKEMRQNISRWVRIISVRPKSCVSRISVQMDQARIVTLAQRNIYCADGFCTICRFQASICLNFLHS